MLRRQPYIECDLHFRAALIIIINDGCLIHALFQLVEVRRDQIAQPLVLLTVLCFIQFLLLRGQLARQTVARVDDCLMQVGRAARHALRPALFLIKGGKQRGKAVRLLYDHHALVLCHR